MSETKDVEGRLADLLDALSEAEQGRYNPRVSMFDRDAAADEANAARDEIEAMFRSLRTEVERLSRERDACREDRLHMSHTLEAMREAAEDRAERAEARCAELEEDRERLDWLDLHADYVDVVSRGVAPWCKVYLMDEDGGEHEADSVREAIDAARRALEGRE